MENDYIFHDIIHTNKLPKNAQKIIITSLIPVYISLSKHTDRIEVKTRDIGFSADYGNYVVVNDSGLVINAMEKRDLYQRLKERPTIVFPGVSILVPEDFPCFEIKVEGENAYLLSQTPMNNATVSLTDCFPSAFFTKAANIVCDGSYAIFINVGGNMDLTAIGHGKITSTKSHFEKLKTAVYGPHAIIETFGSVAEYSYFLGAGCSNGQIKHDDIPASPRSPNGTNIGSHKIIQESNTL